MVTRLARFLFGDRRKIAAAFVVGAVVFPLVLWTISVQRELTVEFELDSTLKHPTQGELFWTLADEPHAAFSADRRAVFTVNPGANVRSVSVPERIGELRFDPIPEPGVVRIRRIEIRGPFGVPLKRWNAQSGFDGWTPTFDVREHVVRDGAWEIRSVGVDPNLNAKHLGPIRAKARRTKLGLALAGSSALALLLHTVLLVLLAPTPAQEAPSPASRRIVHFRVLTVALSTALALGAAWLVWVKLLRPPGRALFPSTYGYSTVLVDHAGRPLSPKDGEVKLMLDPYVGFRNLPRQKGELFSIDEHGFRGAPPPPGRPLAAVLGGSAAFGQGLLSDEQTLSAQLNRLRPAHFHVNAAVIGHLSGQELGMMVHHVDALHPTLYIVFDGWNDLNSQIAHNGVRWPSYGFNQQMFAEVEQHLFDALRLERPPPGLTQPRIDDAENFELIVQSYIDNLVRMHRFARARAARLLVVFQPELGARNRTPAEEQRWQAAKAHLAPQFSEKYRQMRERAAAACGQEGIDCYDLAADAELTTSPDELFSDTVHLTAAGHRIAAELVARHLAQRK